MDTGNENDAEIARKQESEKERIIPVDEDANIRRAFFRNVYLDEHGNNFVQPPQLDDDDMTSWAVCSSPYRPYTAEILRNDKPTTVTLQIPKADILRSDDDDMWLDVHQVKIPLQYAKRGPIVSLVGMYRDKKPGLPFDTRINSYALIRDVLEALGINNKDGQLMEDVSIYTLKPEIFFLVKYQGRIVFVLYRRDPSKEGVFESKETAGQLWSYLNSMKALGDEQPMGAILTYDTVALVTLKDYARDDEHCARVTETRELLQTGVVPVRDPQEFSQGRPSSTDESEDHRKNVNPYEEQPVSREVFYSKVYKDGDVLPCLLQAVNIAFTRVAGGNCREDTKFPRVRHNESLANRLVFKLDETSFDWIRTPFKNKKTKKGFCAIVNNQVPLNNSKCIYWLGKTREEQRSSVYVACSEGGHVCTLKDYWWERGAEEIMLKRAQDEKALWDVVYGSRFHVGLKWLGGKPCLLMPYGYPIDCDDQRDCWIRVPEIRDLLKGLARKRLYFSGSYLQCRLVLLDSNNEIFLGDLESLEDLKDDADEEEEVYKQLEGLLEPLLRGDRQLVLGATITWLKGLSNDETSSLVEREETLGNYFKKDGNESSILDVVKSLCLEGAKDELSAQAKVGLYMLSFFGRAESSAKKPALLECAAPTAAQENPESTEVDGSPARKRCKSSEDTHKKN